MEKKAVIGPIVSVFVMILVISILAGLTFLFVASLKNQVITNVGVSTTEANESGNITTNGLRLAKFGEGISGISVVTAINGSDGVVIPAGNYSLSSTTGILTNTTGDNWDTANITYTYLDANSQTSYQAVNGTELAGTMVVNYLSLIFLAVIFGAILTLVLRIILPYINLGQNMGGF